MDIKIIKSRISKQELMSLAQNQFGDMVKAAIDIDKGIMAIGGEFHADGEVELMGKEGSHRHHIWGINLYPGKKELIEFDSMINLKPSEGNYSRDVTDAEIKNRIKQIVEKLIVG